MVVFDNGSEELGESVVGLSGPSIDADTRVRVLTAREDCLLKGETVRISLVLVLFPYFLSQEFAKQRSLFIRLEYGDACKTVGAF